MEKEKYELNTRGKIAVVLYCLVVLTILALIVLNTTTLLNLENIDAVNIYTTLIASSMFIVASILQLSREILKNKYKNNKILKEDVLSWGFTVALCFLALRIVLNGNKYIFIIYTAVMAITLVLFLTKEMFAISFVEEKSMNYVAFKILLYTLIFSLAIVYIVLFFNSLFEKEIASQIITIIASILGGLLTLSGVAWTIKSNNKDRKADLERIENERKEEERKKIIPYIRLDLPEKASGAVNARFGQGLDFDKKEDLAKLNKKHFYCYKINNFSVKNISKDCIIIESIVVDDKEYVFSGDKLVESGKSTWVKTTENWLVNSANILRSIKLKCKDLIGNSYLLNCVFEVAYPNGLCHIETEIDNIIYKGWDVEYSISRIDLPEFIQTK